MKRTAEPGQTTEAQVNEEGIIDQIRRRFSCTNNRLLVGLGDDAAVIGPEETDASGRRLNVCSQVLATDILIEGVHFSRQYMDLREIGYKSVAVNVSDMAAMGAECVYALGNLGVPRDAGNDDISKLLDGVQEALSDFGASLIGGDTVRSPQWLLSFSMIGSISTKPLTRRGAKVGDVIWHSGELGLSQVGFHELQAGLDDGHRISRRAHVHPQPMLKLGQWLSRNELATSCLDLSDSLSQSLHHLARASGVGMLVDFSEYEFHEELREFARRLGAPVNGQGQPGFTLPAEMNPGAAARRFAGLSDFLLSSSEDYQLLFTTGEEDSERLLSECPVPLRRLGKVLPAAEGLQFVDEHGARHPLESIGYEH